MTVQTRPPQQARPRQRIHWTPQTALQRMDDIEEDLDGILDALEVADKDWVEKKATADLDEDNDFLSTQGEGPIDQRKAMARVATHKQRKDAELAAALVRNLARRLRIMEGKADTARSRNAAVRADAGLAMSGRRP